MRGPGRNREQRQAELLRAAAAVFAEHGYDAATLQQVADRMRITKAALYRYVPGKDALLGEIVGHVLGDGRAILEQYRRADAPVAERLRGVIADHVRFIVRDLDATTVYLHEMHRLPDGLRDRFDREGLVYQHSLRDLVAEGQAAGVVRGDLDAGLVALQILGAVTWMHRWYRPDGRLGPDEIAEQLADVALFGLTPRVASSGSAASGAAVRPTRRAVRTSRSDAAVGAAGVQVRRSEVVEVAASVFAARGYGGASLQEIADRLGILKGSLYHYIESKEDLLLEVVQQVYDGGHEILRRHVEAAGPVPQRLRGLMVDQVIYFVNNATSSAVYLHELHRPPRALRDRLVRKEPGYEALLRALLDEGRAAGSVRAEVDAGLAALQVLGSLNWMYRWYRPGGRLTPTRIGGQLADVLLDGLTPR